MDHDFSMLPESVRTENLDWAARSYCQAINGQPVTCRGCRVDFPITMLFRCFHCGSYFCPKCGKEHFGPRPTHMEVNR